MHKTFLVSTDIEDGRRILRELERLQLPVTAAFWFQDEERDWELVVDFTRRSRSCLEGWLAIPIRPCNFR